MNPLDGPAVRLCTAWVRLYTRRLAPDVASRRRDEVASDLWDHACDAQAAGISRTRTTIEVLGRMLSGLPADLSWRWSMRRTQRQRRALRGGLNVPVAQRSKPLVVLVAIVMAWTALAFVLFGFGDRGLLGYWEYRLVLLVGFVALAVGMRVRERQPVLGFALLAFGALAPSVMYWALILYAPIAIALIVVAYNATFRTPRASDAISV
jgi:hypothetical protein